MPAPARDALWPSGAHLGVRPTSIHHTAQKGIPLQYLEARAKATAAAMGEEVPKSDGGDGDGVAAPPPATSPAPLDAADATTSPASSLPDLPVSSGSLPSEGAEPSPALLADLCEASPQQRAVSGQPHNDGVSDGARPQPMMIATMEADPQAGWRRGDSDGAATTAAIVQAPQHQRSPAPLEQLA